MQTDWNTLQSQTIDWLRFPLAVSVVILHHSASLFPTATGTLNFLCVLFQEGLCRIAVPCFFLISGFLFFNKLQLWDWTVWKRKMVSRIHTLLIPYVLWNLITFLALFCYNHTQSGVNLVEEFARYGGLRFFWSLNGQLPIGGQALPINGPLWFIRDLMYFLLVTPLIYKFIQWTKGYGVLALAILFLAGPRMVPEGFVFFLLGAYLQLSGQNIVKLLWKWRGLLLAASLFFLILFCFVFGASPYWSRFFKFFFLVSGIGAAFCYVAALLDKGKTRVIPFLAGSSFFIFAAHEVLILQEVSAPLVQTMLPTSVPFWSCVEFFLTPAVAVSICLGLLFLLQKLMPGVARVLTGGRKIQVSYNQ